VPDKSKHDFFFSSHYSYFFHPEGTPQHTLAKKYAVRKKKKTQRRALARSTPQKDRGGKARLEKSGKVSLNRVKAICRRRTFISQS